MSAPLSEGTEPPLRKSGEPETARTRLLRAASDLFCRHGINATGVDAIVEAAGTAKATLYKIFGSKETLVEAVLEQEGSAWRQWFLGRVDATPGNARDKLVAIFDILGDWFAEEKFFGCPFINAVGEFDKADDRYKSIALGHKKVVMAHIERLAAEAGCADAPSAAHQLGLLIDGAIVAALVTGDAAIAKHGRAAASSVIGCAMSH